MDILAAADFFTTEAWSCFGLVTYYVLFFIHLGTRKVHIGGNTQNLNAYAQRFILSVKSECLDRMILFGERSLHHVLKGYTAHYHLERNHQGIGNNLLFLQHTAEKGSEQTIECRERLGGLLKFYHRRVQLCPIDHAVQSSLTFPIGIRC